MYRIVLPFAALLLAADLRADPPVCDGEQLGNQSWIWVAFRTTGLPCQIGVTITDGQPMSGYRHAYVFREINETFASLRLRFDLDAAGLMLDPVDQWTLLALDFGGADGLVMTLRQAQASPTGWFLDTAFLRGDQGFQVYSAPVPVSTEPTTVGLQWSRRGYPSLEVALSYGLLTHSRYVFEGFGPPLSIAMGLVDDLDNPVHGSTVKFKDVWLGFNTLR